MSVPFILEYKPYTMRYALHPKPLRNVTNANQHFEKAVIKYLQLLFRCVVWYDV